MIKFEYVLDKTKISMEFPDLEISCVLENFQNFLRSCGYYFEGNIVLEKPKPSARDDEQLLLG